MALAAGGVVFGGGYLLSSYLLRVFNDSDIRIARSWIRRVVPAS
jgi:hypothetical protein